jgi:G3E family GTPase
MPVLVPIDIVTGFLGSGKTTLIQHVISNGIAGRRVAVVVNDLAEYDIDGRVLKGINVDRLVTLTNGCVCCSGIYQLGSALQEIVDAADPSLILIETSGASAPGPVVSELANLGYATDAVITVVDAEQFLPLLESEPVVAEQVRWADFLILNKLDLVDSGRIGKTKSKLGRLNDRAPVLESTFGKVRAELILSTGVSILRKGPRSGTGSSAGSPSEISENFQHFSLGLSDPLDRESFNRFLNGLPREIYRAKGFLRFGGETHPRLFNYTCGRYSLEPFPLPPGLSNDRSPATQIVFIGRNILRLEETLKASMARCAAGAERPSMISRLLKG